MNSVRTTIARRLALTAWGKALLLLALLFHLSLAVSLRTGFWELWTFDSAATQGRLGWDFYALYQAGHNLLTGVSIYESADHLIEIAVPRHTPYRYLPFPAYTLGVLAQLVRAPVAYWLWVMALEGVLLCCAAAAWWLGGGGRRGVLLAAGWLLFTPVYLELYLGQFSLIQAALVLLMLWAVERRRHGAFNVGWALSLLWKQNTGLFIPVLLRHRRWRTLGIGTLAVFLLSAPYFALYPQDLGQFFTNFSSGAPSYQLGNLGVRQWLLSVTSAAVPNLNWPGHLIAQWAWMGLVLALSLWATWRDCGAGNDGDTDLVAPLCLWMSSFFLLYHHVWEHHYVLLLPIYTMLLIRRPSGWLWVLWALTAVWTPYRLIDPQGLAAIDASMRWTPLEPRALDVLYHACKAVPTILLWATLLREVVRRGRPSPRSDA